MTLKFGIQGISATQSSGGGGEGGVTDHAQLTGKAKEDQHPIGAITNLQSTLDSKAKISDIPTNTSQLVNDSGFLDTSNISQFISLGFDGIFSAGMLIFEPLTEPYTISVNHEYELDLHFLISGTIDDDTLVYIENNNTPIQFYTVTHNDVSTPITWGEFKNLATYDDTNGYRWLIKASYHITQSGVQCFVIYPTIIKKEISQFTNDKNYQTLTDVQNLIASIPKFKISIVNELPTTGETMTLYLVPKSGSGNDLYSEYIWVDEISKFELLGVTSVDLTNYVKNTDYATSAKAGVVKIANNIFTDEYTGTIGCTQRSYTEYNSDSVNTFISKGTLSNVLAGKSEEFKFTLSDGSVVTKKIIIGG